MYPALSVLPALGSDVAQVLWVGGQGGMETSLVQRAGIPFTAIPAAGVHGVGICALPRNIALILRGMAASRRVLREFKPDVLLFTGGYVAAPMALAAWRIPTLVYVPDIEPGLALKFLMRFADTIAITAEESRAFLPANKRVVVTGYPTRPDFGAWDSAKARARFGLQADTPVLLVFGGSKGARSINRAVSACLPELLQKYQVLHITGELDWPEIQKVKENLSAEQHTRYHAFPYLHDEIGAAFSAADLVISRAGAATIGEYPLFGLPAILVPYPHAWRYQKVNAAHLANNGAAVMLEDEKLGEELLPMVERLLGNREQLFAMRRAMQSLAVPDASVRIAEAIRKMAQKPERGGRQ